MSQRIVVLDENIANKIAAGEVIERPASVVKELVENAIDAGATRIGIEIEDGGKLLIRVADDGCGMSEQDAVLCFQRHATSKLRSVDDLFRVVTMGFRGEALPSIAAVSQLELVTREAESDKAVRVVVEGGTVTEMETTGAPPGTTITVRNLFFNTPARLKFMRVDATEAGHVSDLAARLALANNRIAFRLSHNGQEVLESPANSDPLAALVAVYGKDAARQMLPLQLVEPSVAITGYVSQPQLNRANRKHQNLFVNRRIVQSKSLSHALNQAYEGLMHGGRYPLAVIMIEIDPGLVDVNVHPTKSEVRFTREWEVHNLLLRAVRETLSAAQLVPELHQMHPRIDPGPALTPQSVQRQLPTHDPPSAAVPDPWQRSPVMRPESVPAAPADEPGDGPLRLTPVGQIRNTYILCESDKGLMIVNQHRAHERVLMEKHRAWLEGRQVESQRLVIPFTLNLSPREASLLDGELESLRGMGFDIEPFGRETYLVRAVPIVLARQNCEEVLRDVIDELSAANSSRAVADRTHGVKAMMACRSAIRAGDSLTNEEIAQLIADLVRTSNPYICPHGQPIVIGISNMELDKRFERM